MFTSLIFVGQCTVLHVNISSSFPTVHMTARELPSLPCYVHSCVFSTPDLPSYPFYLERLPTPSGKCVTSQVDSLRLCFVISAFDCRQNGF